MQNESKTILFIQPYDRPWTDTDGILSRKKMYVGRAPFEISCCVPREYEISLLDLNIELRACLPKSVEDVVSSAVCRLRPGVIFISMPSYAQGGQVEQVVRACHAVAPKTKIILGGAAISLIKEAPLRWGWPITGCYNGFGEEVPDILEAIFGDDHPPIPGVYWAGQAHKNAPESRRNLIDDYSPEDFYAMQGRLDFNKHLTSIRSVGLNPLGILEMTRGCTGSCSFCAINKQRMGCFARKPETVIAEARCLASQGIEYLHIIDPTFGLMKNETWSLLDQLNDFHSAFPKVGVEVLTRPSLITDVFAERLKRAGVKRCGIGMETMEEEDLTRTGKKSGSAHVKRAVSLLAKYGIETKLFHILFPGRVSLKTIGLLLDLSEEGLPFIVQSSFLRNLPGRHSSSPFSDHDQTVFNPSLDTAEQVEEWMLANLPFNSMDFGRGDKLLIKGLRKAGSDFQKLLQVRQAGNSLEVNLGDYGFVGRPGEPMHKCIERR